MFCFAELQGLIEFENAVADMAARIESKQTFSIESKYTSPLENSQQTHQVEQLDAFICFSWRFFVAFLGVTCLVFRLEAALKMPQTTTMTTSNQTAKKKAPGSKSSEILCSLSKADRVVRPKVLLLP
jgi:hypothetical protein